MNSPLKHLFLAILLFFSSISAMRAGSASPPQVKAYVSLVHPLITVDKTGASYNFKDNYVVGVPVGINLFKNDSSVVGFTFELAPFLKFEKGSDRVSNFLFHPGVLFRVKRGKTGFTAIIRGAFETSGRYGFTPILNQTLPVKTKKPVRAKFFIATPLPVRFGAGKPPSFNISLQMGVVF